MRAENFRISYVNYPSISNSDFENIGVHIKLTSRRFPFIPFCCLLTIKVAVRCPPPPSEAHYFLILFAFCTVYGADLRYIVGKISQHRVFVFLMKSLVTWANVQHMSASCSAINKDLNKHREFTH